ncbi:MULTISPECIES: quinoprotein relay system zinc metallohydrolase 2 [unclassified Caballeronia]|uniref:quinoprotein relay system zinc metallohydrolase 2 n=1 Tax=unclassified Caballeronia TaxID=2646786 RepID=UPI00285D39D4|nr:MULTISPECIES: quinoprotein relay system zinc metallohydrolase 2 [unclassified Caballeronia]MDR5739945.1 quinoprotein relay system zinc metallohydrolase 2 [Caballeronia sp. LZ016]MDR5807337.1 quinoprotein relay system zinc metallohydrolase 2 [Caballeronia sp. LZ019]
MSMKTYAAPPFAVQPIAPGNYVHRGDDDVATPANGGDIANVGFIVGARCVAVVDTGGTLAEGRQLRAAIRAVTPLPVCYVINTHMHPDHIFGNAAFKDDHPQFVGSAKLAQAEAARADNYLRALKRELGAAADGSEIIAPTLTVDTGITLDLGDRTLTLQTWKTAHTNNDITVYDERSGTLWLGDLLFVRCIPVVDGSVTGWLDDIARIKQMNPRHVVPGHGPLDAPWPESIEAQEQYLAELARDVRAAIKRGNTIQQAVDTVGVDQRDKWLLYEVYHRRNVTAAYAELEWEK